MTRRAYEIERRTPESVDADLRSEHLGYTSSAIMQSVAALEADSWEVINNGPAHHLGSSENNSVAIAFLQPLSATLERLDGIQRYAAALHLLGKPALDKGAQPLQDTQLLIRLRNEITHYKSRSGSEMASAKLYESLRNKNFPKPPFWPATGVNLFPLQCLSASCADWAVRTAFTLMNAVYARFEVKSPFAGYPMHWFTVEPENDV